MLTHYKVSEKMTQDGPRGLKFVVTLRTEVTNASRFIFSQRKPFWNHISQLYKKLGLVNVD